MVSSLSFTGSEVATTLIAMATKNSMNAMSRSPLTTNIPTSHIITNAQTPATIMFLVSNCYSALVGRDPVNKIGTRPSDLRMRNRSNDKRVATSSRRMLRT